MVGQVAAVVPVLRIVAVEIVLAEIEAAPVIRRDGLGLVVQYGLRQHAAVDGAVLRIDEPDLRMRVIAVRDLQEARNHAGCRLFQAVEDIDV